MLFITHDLSIVRYMSDRIAVMRAGKIIETAGAEEIYQNPTMEYTRNLLAAIPKVAV
jgi:ABC-type dipeptide/oligopeptide/nickel transport system ATPase component